MKIIKIKNKLKCVNGFLLIELLIAIFLWSIILFYVTNFTISIYKNLSKLQSECIKFSDICDACTKMIDEISNAPNDLNSWKLYSEKEMKWKNRNNETISFYFYKKKLVQYMYSSGRSRRLEILENLNDIKFEYIIRDNLMKGVRFVINAFEDNKIECWVCCKGG